MMAKMIIKDPRYNHVSMTLRDGYEYDFDLIGETKFVEDCPEPKLIRELDYPVRIDIHKQNRIVNYQEQDLHEVHFKIDNSDENKKKWRENDGALIEEARFYSVGKNSDLPPMIYKNCWYGGDTIWGGDSPTTDICLKCEKNDD